MLAVRTGEAVLLGDEGQCEEVFERLTAAAVGSASSGRGGSGRMALAALVVVVAKKTVTNTKLQNLKLA